MIVTGQLHFRSQDYTFQNDELKKKMMNLLYIHFIMTNPSAMSQYTHCKY